MKHIIANLEGAAAYHRYHCCGDQPLCADYERAAAILRGYGAEPEDDEDDEDEEEPEEGGEDETHKDPRYQRLLILTLKAALTGATGSCVAVDCAVDAASDAYDDLFYPIDYL
jgi:dTDP-4-dehydrorhamnose reductase